MEPRRTTVDTEELVAAVAEHRGIDGAEVTVDVLLDVVAAAAGGRQRLLEDLRLTSRVRRIAIATAARRDGCAAISRRLGMTRQRVSQIMHEVEEAR